MLRQLSKYAKQKYRLLEGMQRLLVGLLPDAELLESEACERLQLDTDF